MKLQLLVQELVEHGLTEGEIASKTGMSTQSSIHRIKTGETKCRNFEVGLEILGLHKRVFPEKHNEQANA